MKQQRTWLIAETGSLLVPAWYLCGAIVASGVALRLYPEQPGSA